MSAKLQLREWICKLIGHAPRVDNYGYTYCTRCYDHLPARRADW